MKYVKPLDSIRAIAVILVIISHWLHYKYIDVFALGSVGVNIFFVLSGFLITRILLENKKDAELNNLNKFDVIKNFIIRRTLRIFPIYYLTIFILFFLNEKAGTSIRGHFEYYVSYSSNVLFFIHQNWEGKLSHLWSLAVEEQFYLIWPWLIIFINPKYLFTTIGTFFLFGVFSNNFLAFIFPHHKLVEILTPTCFDAFSAGAILSYFLVYKAEHIKPFARVISYLAPACFLAFVFSSLFNYHLPVPHRTLISISALYLIFFTIHNRGSILHKYVLNNKFLIFMGKISYGIYLYHNFVPSLWGTSISKLNELDIHIPLVNSLIPQSFSGEFMLIGKFGFLILFSWLSWTLIEYPINKLKDRFNYRSPLKQPSGKVAPEPQPVTA